MISKWMFGLDPKAFIKEKKHNDIQDMVNNRQQQKSSVLSFKMNQSGDFDINSDTSSSSSTDSFVEDSSIDGSIKDSYQGDKKTQMLLMAARRKSVEWSTHFHNPTMIEDGDHPNKPKIAKSGTLKR